MAHLGGRPTKYLEKYCQEIIDFVSDPINHDPVPQLLSFAIHINVHTDTLNEWCKVHPEFSDAYKKAKEICENVYHKKSMEGELSTAYMIFYGKNVFGMRDRWEGSIGGSGDPIQIKSKIEVSKKIAEIDAAMEKIKNK